jgi:hypothetical protein
MDADEKRRGCYEFSDLADQVDRRYGFGALFVPKRQP